MAVGDIDNDQSEWFIAGPGNKPYGPYPFAKLLEYVADGRLRRDSLVHRKGTDNWIPAAEVSGLFRAARVAPVPETRPSVVPTTPPAVLLTCQTCRSGILSRKHLYRMSDVVVVIGYILLFPSLIGMAVTLALTGYAIVFSIVVGAAAKDPQAFVAGGVVAVFTVAFGAAVFVSCFVSGLVGWLLVMKKTVLRCNLCGMTIDAA
jgi:hypothetical protein